MPPPPPPLTTRLDVSSPAISFSSLPCTSQLALECTVSRQTVVLMSRHGHRLAAWGALGAGVKQACGMPLEERQAQWSNAGTSELMQLECLPCMWLL